MAGRSGIVSEPYENRMNHAYQRYHAAAARMDSLIDMTPSPTDTSREAVRERASYRMGRLVEFMERLGSPHIGRPVVHLGGTSGKGSTSTIIAAMLTAAGYRTGLHTSPYLQTPAEKLQVNGELISAEDYVELVEAFFAEHDGWIADGYEPLTYGEGFNALMWMFFRQQNVDVCVVEVGAGGRFDLTNILQPTLSVITSVGIDHTNTLGNTIADISWHKAGIIKSGVPVVCAVPNLEAQRIIRDEAETVGAPLLQIDLDTEIQDMHTGPDGTFWTEASTGQSHHMRMAGSFQARNGQLAITAMRTLRSSGFEIPEAAIDEGLLIARIPGRAEMINDVVPVILDGAHNAEKLAAFAADVPALLPDVPGRRIVVAGLLDAKAGDKMIRSLVPVMDMLIATSPQVLGKDAKVTTAIRDYAEEAGFRGVIVEEPDPTVAIQMAMDAARPGEDAIIVTGSLYLVGNVRGRWYPEEAIMKSHSSWPVRVEIE